jgi:hypothetical protein
MKKILVCLVILTFPAIIFAQNNMQDVVYLKNGSIIRGIIIEQVPNVSIKIQTGDNNIFVFDMGEIERMTKEPTTKAEFNESQSGEKFFSRKKNKYFSLALGYGNSYGALGIRLQQRFGNKLGFGWHAGVGYFPGQVLDMEPSVWFCGGAKFFWYKAWYIDITYGTVARYKQENYYWGYYYDYQSEEGNLYGPSFLLGGDWFFNKVFGMNGALGVSLIPDNLYYEQNAVATIDFGFVFKF